MRTREGTRRAPWLVLAILGIILSCTRSETVVCYTLTMLDSWGDGWDNSTYYVDSLSGTLATG